MFCPIALTSLSLFNSNSCRHVNHKTLCVISSLILSFIETEPIRYFAVCFLFEYHVHIHIGLGTGCHVYYYCMHSVACSRSLWIGYRLSCLLLHAFYSMLTLTLDWVQVVMFIIIACILQHVHAHFELGSDCSVLLVN